MGHNWIQWLAKLPYVGERLAVFQSGALAPRPLRLVLDLPVERITSLRRAGQEKPESPPESWIELHGYPIELLRNIDRYLRRLNTERIPAGKRRKWLEDTLQYACPALRRVYSDHYKGDTLPESHDRREGLMVAIKVCRQLAIGYKRQLMQDFALPDSRYVYVRDRVRFCALRVLELIHMEQRLRSMRYQKLPGSVWLDCNRLFFAVAQCEDVNESRPALACLQLYLDRRSDEIARRAPTTLTLRQAYLAIQLYGLMDACTLSSHKLHIVDEQLNHSRDVLLIMADDSHPLVPGRVLIYCIQDRPAFFERQDEKAQMLLRQGRKLFRMREKEGTIPRILPALQIDIAPLAAALAAERERLAERFRIVDVVDKAATVIGQNDVARLLVVETMCDRLHPKRRIQSREYAIGQQILYVYNGFMSVYKLLVDMVEEDEDLCAELALDNELRDALAGRSALIAADVTASELGQWFVLDRSAGGVHVKTRESQFTTAMFIGQVLACGFSRGELRQPRLGYVTRMNRDGEGDIEVSIRTLSSRAEAIAVQSRFLSQNDMALPAILLKDDAGTRERGQWRLMLHQSHRLAPGTPVQIDGGGRQQDYEIGELQEMQREFVIYWLLAENGAADKA